ncbi:HAD-IIA family hydrolase [Spiribacter halobius]|uniref:Pyridoxal phosphate phosphatase n=1 Tax=Sediminicurvatus halobius TaxID=2182432 RepID=A0A2U2N8N6_9GAMM|nr:HAD-IIA family hydrolase [Spiribacter halobius]PWG65443.1 pyridoxal phosphate phosphatase [Spiribacter halobius]UEX76463.1 HAD-IIA family hydrolase [Spiribacter halobius]
MSRVFRHWLLDLDGVVYVGDAPLPGAPEAVETLRRRGCRVRFLTNDPLPTRAAAAARLERYGIPAEAKDMVTSGWATARTLRGRGLERVAVIGSDGLREEIAAAGLALVSDDSAEALVVGCDDGIGYADLRLGVRLLHRGAAFVATNADAVFPTPEGPAPATGAIVAALRYASGREAEVIGKPSPAMFEAALEGAPREAAVMVGDTPATDIAGARRAGIAAVLVAADGASPGLPPELRPDRVVRGLAELLADG